MCTIEHVALWSSDIERLKDFYEMYFGAKSNQKYVNPKKNLQTYFLEFETGTRLELMQRPEVYSYNKPIYYSGYTHLAFSLGTKEEVDSLTKRLTFEGYQLIDGPRTTGDGYYESVVMDPDGNYLELTI